MPLLWLPQVKGKEDRETGADWKALGETGPAAGGHRRGGSALWLLQPVGGTRLVTKAQAPSHTHSRHCGFFRDRAPAGDRMWEAASLIPATAGVSWEQRQSLGTWHLGRELPRDSSQV